MLSLERRSFIAVGAFHLKTTYWKLRLWNNVVVSQLEILFYLRVVLRLLHKQCVSGSCYPVCALHRLFIGLALDNAPVLLPSDLDMWGLGKLYSLPS